MNTFTYNGREYDIDLHGDPYLEAAFKIAVDAHKNHEPRKNSGKPYIDHLITVYNILDKFGGTDKQKAIGLLHDTVEDYYSVISQTPVEKLRDDLQARLAPRKPDDKWLSDVCNGVANLTNGAILYDNKRTWRISVPEDFKEHKNKRIYQTRRAREVKEDLREIKIADQAASVLEDIMYCKLPDYRNKSQNRDIINHLREKELLFALKGYDVADAAANSNENNPFFSFYARLYIILHDMYDDAIAGRYDAVMVRRKEVLRPGFLDELIEESKSHKKLSILSNLKLPENVTHWHPPHQPIERITISRRTGMVVGYRFRDDEASRKIMGSLLTKLEEERGIRITTRSYVIHEHGRATNVIDFHIKRLKNDQLTDMEDKDGLDFGLFIDKALAAGAIQREVKEAAKAVKAYNLRHAEHKGR